MRWQEEPTGLVDGANTIFTTAEMFCQDPPYMAIKVFRNGQQQSLDDDYTVSESGGAGTGFDTVTFAVGCTPKVGEILRVDYAVD